MVHSPAPSKSAPPALWLVAGLSLALNIAVIAIALVVIAAARRAAGEVADQLALLRSQTFTYSAVVSQTVRVQTTVPFHENIVVPVADTLNVDTSVSVDKDLPVVGPISLEIPIKTTVPFKFQVPISINRDLPVDASVPISLTVPVRVAIQDTPANGQITAIIALLNRFAGR